MTRIATTMLWLMLVALLPAPTLAAGSGSGRPWSRAAFLSPTKKAAPSSGTKKSAVFAVRESLISERTEERQASVDDSSCSTTSGGDCRSDDETVALLIVAGQTADSSFVADDGGCFGFF